MKILLIVGFIISYCSLFLNLIFFYGHGAKGQVLWVKNVAGISTLTTTSFGLSADYKFGLPVLTNAQTLCYDNTPINSSSVEGNISTEIKLALKWVL